MGTLNRAISHHPGLHLHTAGNWVGGLVFFPFWLQVPKATFVLEKLWQRQEHIWLSFASTSWISHFQNSFKQNDHHIFPSFPPRVAVIDLLKRVCAAILRHKYLLLVPELLLLYRDSNFYSFFRKKKKKKKKTAIENWSVLSRNMTCFPSP